MSFDLSSYEDVNSRIKRFRETHILGRIITEIVEIDVTKGYVIIRASVFREHEDVVPAAIDYAYELRTDRGVNRDFWIENCSTSAIGRAIGLLMPSESRPTRQDMEKVERLAAQPAVEVDLWATAIPAVKVDGVGSVRPAAETIKDIKAQLGGEIVDPAPICSHGRMVYKEGVSEKTGNKYRGYTCSSKTRGDQCKPIWL
jgi:ribosomal protein L20